MWQLGNVLIEAGPPVQAMSLIQASGPGQIFQYKPGTSFGSFLISCNAEESFKKFLDPDLPKFKQFFPVHRYAVFELPGG